MHSDDTKGVTIGKKGRTVEDRLKATKMLTERLKKMQTPYQPVGSANQKNYIILEFIKNFHISPPTCYFIDVVTIFSEQPNTIIAILQLIAVKAAHFSSRHTVYRAWSICFKLKELH